MDFIILTNNKNILYKKKYYIKYIYIDMNKMIEKYRGTLLLMKYRFMELKEINNLSEYEFDRLVKITKEELE